MIERDVQQLLARVAKLERQVAYMAEQLSMQVPDDLTGASQRVMALVRAGDRVAAIKAYREETGVDLLTAKTFVESL
jgi:ribosomal protein L7/L12